MKMKMKMKPTKNLILIAAIMGINGVSFAENHTKQANFGVSFEQQSYLRNGVFVEAPVHDYGYLGLTFGNQDAVAKASDGSQRGRKSVDGGLYWYDRADLAPHFQSRLGIQVGYQSYRSAAATSSNTFGYFDLFYGFLVSYGKVDFFSDLALRSASFGSNKEVLIGDQRVNNVHLYPRLGIAGHF